MNPWIVFEWSPESECERERESSGGEIGHVWTPQVSDGWKFKGTMVETMISSKKVKHPLEMV